MALRRRLLGFLSLASLAVLVYGGVSLAFSVPVDEEDARSNGLPGPSRAIVVPVVDPTLVPTFAGNGSERVAGFAGAVLAWGDVEGSFPASAENVSFGRALAFVHEAVNGTYAEGNLTFENVPSPGENGTATRNFTLDVNLHGDGGRGFLVKPDGSDQVVFVNPDRVVGQVLRFDPPARVWLLLLGGGLGFVLPIVVLIVTHRPAGVQGAPYGVCPECRAPTAPGLEFCTRCGAYTQPRGSEADG